MNEGKLWMERLENKIEMRYERKTDERERYIREKES